MPTVAYPTKVIVNGRVYKLAGERERSPKWQVARAPSQPGDFVRPRAVQLGDGSAGIVGSHRHGARPSPHGVADVTNGDTSYDDRYGAGPGVTTISLATGNTLHAAGSIGGSLTIGGGGAPSIGGGAISATPTAIWADGVDGAGRQTRYIYCIAGGRLKVIDPTTDLVVETTEWLNVNGGDAARWAGAWWLARRGGPSDFVKYVSVPFVAAGSTSFIDADFTAAVVHAGPDAFYRAYKNFSGSAALVKKSTSTTVADVDSDTNWAPSSGETMGDPAVPITNLATLGERLVVGKEDGLGEMDADFTFRQYLEWMQAFAWEHNCRVIVPLGSGGDVITGYRRGLYLLPLNRGIGTEVLQNNATDKKGRYTAAAFDGNWLYLWLESPATDDTHLIKMRPRRLPGPGLFEHHPIVTITDKQTLVAYLWPGATVSGTIYGPRLYFGHGSNSLAYIRLGETQPDQDDANARFTTGQWTIQWPHDDFDTPHTLKMPYKVEADYANAGATGMTWAVSPDGTTFTNLDLDGSGTGATAVTTDGYHQRFGPRDNSLTGRELVFRLRGTGGSATAQQRVQGRIVAYLLEQPEMLDVATATFQLERSPWNDEDAEEQWRTLKALDGKGPREVHFEWGDDAAGTTAYAMFSGVQRAATVASADAPGVILAELTIRTLDFTDG